MVVRKSISSVFECLVGIKEKESVECRLVNDHDVEDDSDGSK